MKPKIALFLLLTILALKTLVACTGRMEQQDAPASSLPATQPEEKAVAEDWKTYTNTKLGFTFQYPGEWIEEGKAVEVTNLKGTVTEIDINFTNAATKTTLLIAYHLPPNGAELYKYAVSQYNLKQGWYEKNANEIEVAGTKGIEANMEITADGRGRKLATPIRSIIVDFQDKKQTGEIQMQFQTAISENDKEVAQFNRLLSGFKFID